MDDATYVSYTSPTYGGLGSVLKWFSKTDDLIRWADVVTCGNRGIAEYVSGKGANARVVPTVVDTDVFKPDPGGTARNSVGAGLDRNPFDFPLPGIYFPGVGRPRARPQISVSKSWAPERKASQSPASRWKIQPGKSIARSRTFNPIDIGLYPIDASLYSGWASGKSGFKAVQYMAVGVPYVATPVGGSAEIGVEGTTHLFATTNEEWRQALNDLLANADRRQQMGAAGRRHVIEHFGLEAQADKLASSAAERRSNQRNDLNRGTGTLPVNQAPDARDHL